MPEEQIIYLDPNDELTKVREKIEETPARHITLVVPQQTQLRSNVGWRLLHARSREMGKEIHVISPDRQIRSVAKAAGFKVRDSQESSLSSKFRPASRPSTRPSARTAARPQANSTRNGIEKRVVQRTHGPASRDLGDNRDLRQRDQPPLREQQQPPQPPAQPAQSTWLPRESMAPRLEESITGKGTEEAYPPFEIIEDDEYGRPYEFRVGDTHASSAHPSIAHQDEEEQDPFIEDYRFSKRIRENAQGARDESKPPANAQEPASAFPTPRFSTPPEPTHTYPFEDGEEFSPSSLPEQRGSTFVPGVEEGEQHIADIPTDVHEIEFLGERDDFVDAQDILTYQLPDENMNEPGEVAPPRTYGARSGRRSGQLQRRAVPEFGDPDDLPPVEDRQTLTPASAPRLSGSLNAPRAGTRGAPPPAQPQQAARNVNARPVSPPSRPITGVGRPTASRPVARQPGRPSGQRGGRITATVLVALLLLVLIGIGLLYFGTTATVAITVPSKSLNVNPIKLQATTNPQDKLHNTVPSQVLSYTASVSGQGTATGTTTQGNAKASGTVNITNNGQQQVTIPTGTVLTTTAGTNSVQFVTTAEAVIPSIGSNNSTVPVPVEAQAPGNSGNVGPNTIVVIPAGSITTIAQASNINSSQVNLTVTNSGELSGGGAAPAPAVTNSDLQALAASLHQQLQAQVRTWLKQHLLKGDIQGTPSPDVLGSAQPLAQERLSQTPSVGQPLTSKTFSGQLSARITVLVVRAESLVAAAQAQLNKTALAMRPAFVLAMQQPITLNKVTSTASNNGSSISIDLSATGRIMPQVNTQVISAYISGKTVDQAKSDIASGNAGPGGVEDIKIEVSPSFLSIMPFRSDHIHIIVLPGPGSTKALPNG
ncbi:MAG: hypothetical protein NVS3B14_12260 [Ktedonobacteraceae bacterium]